MAGMLARDHELARVLYLSKGAGSVASLALEPADVVSCSQGVTCELGECCAPTDWSCREGVPAEGGVCIWQVPAPWTSYGRDTDGDGVGDGTTSDRATPAERQFALVHREEGAWNYSPEVFALWGLGGGRETYFDADGSGAPTSGTQLLSTGPPPRNRSCSAHQSMGGDSCQPRDAAGVPLMAPIWRFVMSVGLPGE